VKVSIQRSTILVIAVIVLGVGLGIVGNSWLVQLGRALLLPFFGIGRGIASNGEQLQLLLTPRSELIKENIRLRVRVEELELEVQRLQEVERENRRLRSLIGWQQQAPWKLKLARVIGRDPSSWWRVVQIDVGEKDGVEKDAPVLTPAGLVGKVGQVDKYFSWVYLIGDPRCRVSVVVEEGPMGIIQNASSATAGIVDLNYLPKSAELRPGQRVFTSGVGGIFPKGIPIGVVIDSEDVELGLYKRARVRLSADISRLEEVWVMIK